MSSSGPVVVLSDAGLGFQNHGSNLLKQHGPARPYETDKDALVYVGFQH